MTNTHEVKLARRAARRRFRKHLREADEAFDRAMTQGLGSQFYGECMHAARAAMTEAVKSFHEFNAYSNILQHDEGA